jgi:protein-tyrosine-phosphatase
VTTGGEAVEGEAIAGAPAAVRQPQSVLFACRMNAIRSPMAAAIMRRYFRRLTYVASAGILKGEHDPFVDIVMAEIGIDMSMHEPKTFDELEELEGLNFDLVISLSPEAHHRAIELTRTLSVDIEYWPTPEPDGQGGNREQCLAAYREVRDHLMGRIRTRFVGAPATSAG